MLGPFATASRRTPIRQVSLLSHAARRLSIDVHDNDNDNAWQRGPLWPHGMVPIIGQSSSCLLDPCCSGPPWGGSGTLLVDAARTAAAAGSLVQLLLEKTSENFVACGVDDRVQARVDEVDQREQDVQVAIQQRNLISVHTQSIYLSSSVQYEDVYNVGLHGVLSNSQLTRETWKWSWKNTIVMVHCWKLMENKHRKVFVI